MKIVIVNNTGKDIRGFEGVIADAIRNFSALPEEIKIVKINGEIRGILDWA